MLYVGEGGGAVVIGEVNPFGDDPSFEVMPHEKKGGLRLNDYLTYNCLENQVIVQQTNYRVTHRVGENLPPIDLVLSKDLRCSAILPGQ